MYLIIIISANQCRQADEQCQSISVNFYETPNQDRNCKSQKFAFDPNQGEQETAKDGMAGLQSGNQIWEDWLRTSLNAMVNLRYCRPWNLNGQSQGHTNDNKIWEDPLRTNLNAKVYLQVIYCKNIKWPWTEKSRSRSHRKVAVKEIWSRSINMQSIMSVIINMNKSKLKRKG